MPILHKNITAETDIHNPKWFSNANNGDYAWKNEQGNLESIDELLLPAALNFVDGSVAPPTSNTGDIYVLSSGGSVNAGWGSVSLQDWVRYDGAAWNAITPQKSSLCYNENTDSLLSFNGLAWAAIGGGDSIYSASGTAFTDVEITIDNTLTFEGGDFRVQGSGTGVGTTLALYDNDTIPNVIWEWLDNGNVNINQNSTINLNDSLTFTSSNGDFILNENNGRVSMDGDKAGVEMGDASIPARLGYFRSGALGSDSRALVLQGEPTVGAPVIVYSRDDVLFEVGTFNYDGTNRRMSIKSNNISIYNNDLFIVDPLSTSAPTQIAANVINLKGKTAIKGAGTSGASMLNLYDGNESVMWQWLDDGSLKVDGSTGFTGTGSYTNFTIKNGIITAAS